MTNKNESLKWLHEQHYITCDADIEDVAGVRGVYGFFVKSDKEEKCAYVGRSSNIYIRMFAPDGHISRLRKNSHANQQLTKAVENKGEIKIRILEKVPYVFDNYYKDMQRLASAESKYIDCYQKQEQCLEQIPEGTTITPENWENERLRQKAATLVKE